MWLYERPYKQCEHGYHHPPWPHACDGCMHEDEDTEQ